MNGAVEYFGSHIYFLFILIALAAVTFFFCIKAGKAASQRHKENDAIIKKLEADTALRREFSDLTPEKAKSSEPEKLFKGVALGLVRDIEKSSSMLDTFSSFTDEQKMIYSLYFLFEDGSEKLSSFFKLNGSPLTDFAGEAIEKIYGGKIFDVFSAEYKAYDDKDETTSLIPAEIEKHDSDFLSLIAECDLMKPAADFIIDNIEKFTV